jgi:signal transduction histidine kinase
MAVNDDLARRADLLVDAAPYALVVLDRDGGVVRTNTAAQRLLCVADADGPGSLPLDVFDDRTDMFADAQRQLRAGQHVSVVAERHCPHEPRADLQLEAVAVFDDDGNYLGAVCSLRDVTTELAAAAELAERQRLVEWLMNAVREINADLDLNDVLQRICESAASLVAGCCACLCVLDGADLVAVAQYGGDGGVVGTRLPADEGLIAEALRTGEPTSTGDIQLSSPWVAANELLSHLRTVFCVPTMHNGDLNGGLYVGFEQTDHALSANELGVLTLLAAHAGPAFGIAREHADLVRAQARQKAVIDATADGMAVLDSGGLVAIWNSAAELLTGIPAHEAIGAPPPFAVGTGRAIDHQLATGRWLEVIASLVTGTGERVLDFRDITQNKRLDEARDLFLATTSPELRTPITVVKGFAGTLLHRWDALTDAERRASVATIVHRTESLASLVDQLLRGATTGEGYPVTLSSFDIGAALRGALAGFEALSEGHTLVLQVPAGLPPVGGDRASIDNILAQLVENAIKYSPDGGQVRVVASHEGDVIAVRVSDEGIGLDDDDAELIFERFYQVGGGDRRRFGGLGLGLYIVRRLVEAQSGSVRAYGTPGVGATVEFTLPVASPSLRAETGGDLSSIYP